MKVLKFGICFLDENEKIESFQIVEMMVEVSSNFVDIAHRFNGHALDEYASIYNEWIKKQINELTKERSTDIMKTLKVGICFLDEKDNVVSKRVIDAAWTVDIENELSHKFNVCVIDEIANILLEQLKMNLNNTNMISEMLQEVKNGTNNS